MVALIGYRRTEGGTFVCHLARSTTIVTAGKKFFCSDICTSSKCINFFGCIGNEDEVSHDCATIITVADTFINNANFPKRRIVKMRTSEKVKGQTESCKNFVPTEHCFLLLRGKVSLRR